VSISCRRFGQLLVIGLALFFSPLAQDAAQGDILIDFNGLPGNASNAQVQSYLNAQLGAGFVTVSGAAGGNGYTGEGHVVGPGGQSQTLGTLDGGNFIVNDRDNGSSMITMTFAQPITGVKFDFQIFPNSDALNGLVNDPSHFPDFTFKANPNGQLTTMLYAVGVLPGAVNPLTGATTELHSPNSGNGANELAPQLLVTGMPGFSFPGGVTVLQFIDWPPRIGIDNLQLTFAGPPPVAAPVAEPSSLLIACATASMLGVAQLLRRRRLAR
jgi:hypothetical protein